jgi:hypothetical protein
VLLGIGIFSFAFDFANLTPQGSDCRLSLLDGSVSGRWFYYKGHNDDKGNAAAAVCQ